MIIAQVIDNKVEELGYFPSVEEAREVYGEQSQLLEFQSMNDLNQFRKVQEHIRMAHKAFHWEE